MSKFYHACELHCHTLHSDGAFAVNELMQTALERKLSGICLTDHNTTSGWAELDENSPLAVLKGIEWTTYFGHMLALGTSSYVDWRDAVPDNIDGKMKEVHEKGGLVGIAHPFQLGTPICTGGHWDYNVRDFSLVDYMEVWSEGNPFMNTPNKRAYALWVSLLDKGFKIAPAFGRDWHNASGDIYPSACTYLCTQSESLTPDDIKSSIKNGKTSLTVGPLFTFDIESGTASFSADFTRMQSVAGAPHVEPKTIKVLTNGGEEVLKLPYDKCISVPLEAQDKHYYRAELWGAVDGKEEQLIALTSPIYVGY